MTSEHSQPFPVSDHCDGRQFFNPEPVAHRAGDLWRWWRNRAHNPWQRVTDFTPPAPPPQRSQPPRITWVGHATLLIQIDGRNLLTDPVWSERVGPQPWLGPRRYHPPAIRFDDLPPIDVVLISHSHYDHLDRPTIRRLIAAHDPLFVCPLGLDAWFEHVGTQRVITLDWWQQQALNEGISIHATPARHWSNRTMLDRNRSLWCGYYVTAPSGAVFFAGDTGMGDHFAAIRERFGAPDVALLPIGAYEPRWFMHAQHMNPADAVDAHVKLGAKKSIGIHFGTFKLSDEGQHDPVHELAHDRRNAGLSADVFVAPAFGESPI